VRETDGTERTDVERERKREREREQKSQITRDIRVRTSVVFPSERWLFNERAVTRTPPIFSARKLNQKDDSGK
jgi:hypothetical protein